MIKKAMYRFLIVLAAALLFGAREARSGTILYYTGDPNGSAAYGNYQDLNGSLNIPLSQVFEDFIVSPGSTWTITSMFVNETDLGPSTISNAVWSIRTGMGSGNGGTVLYSGTNPATEGSGSPSQITVAGLNITLPPGQYWMNVTPQTSGTKLVANTTTGLNEINATLTQAGLWYEPQFQNYTPVQADFSIGINGTKLVPTPEPATWFIFAVALAGCALFFKPTAVAARVVRSNRGWRK